MRRVQITPWTPPSMWTGSFNTGPGILNISVEVRDGDGYAAAFGDEAMEVVCDSSSD